MSEEPEVNDTEGIALADDDDLTDLTVLTMLLRWVTA
jgi:hypothetical protein